MTTRWADFYPHVSPLVSGCPYPTIDHHLRLASQDFCQRTLCWRKWLDPVTTTEDEDTYDLNIDGGQEIVQLLRATLDGSKIDVLAQDDLPANWQEGAGGVSGLFTPDRIQFVVLPVPAADLSVLIEAAVKPSNTATGIDDAVARHYMNHIATGAVARIHAMPGRDFSVANSPSRKEYEDLLAQAASEVFHAFSRAPRRVRGQYL